ncbi:unnamed protein product [Phytophthora lilii]|uniref:Unnamed protein product n=1 Tax=Phytophthora lilii TaxID=2077276 RepID=A0A9W6WT25_9STRA|nr:unnamed protein product [Phytophthora lilii]
MRYRLLARRLQPEVLRREVKRLAQVTHRHVKTDDIALYELIVDRAKHQHQDHLLNQELKASRGSKASEPKQDAGRNGQAAKPASASGSRRGGDQERPQRSSNRENNGSAARSHEPPRDGCLSCKGAHSLKDCPTATEAQKEEARQRFAENKQQRTR